MVTQVPCLAKPYLLFATGTAHAMISATSMLKGRLTCMLDAFDILGNLNNVTRAINAQGRTETWTNTLPRYVMFHVAWNMTSKKK